MGSPLLQPLRTSYFNLPLGYLALKLSSDDARKKVVGVRIARRKDLPSQALNVNVTVGPSREYDPEEPQCTMIPQLKPQEGETFVDYFCKPALGQYLTGQFVKFSNDQDYLTICEARVLVQDISQQIEGALRDVLTQRLFPDVQALPKQLQNAALAVLNGAGIPTDDDDIKAPFLIALQEVVDAKIKDSQQPLSEKKVDKVVLDIQRVAGKILGMAMQMP